MIERWTCDWKVAYLFDVKLQSPIRSHVTRARWVSPEAEKSIVQKQSICTVSLSSSREEHYIKTINLININKPWYLKFCFPLYLTVSAFPNPLPQGISHYHHKEDSHFISLKQHCCRKKDIINVLLHLFLSHVHELHDEVAFVQQEVVLDGSATHIAKNFVHTSVF